MPALHVVDLRDTRTPIEMQVILGLMARAQLTMTLLGSVLFDGVEEISMSVGCLL